MLCKKNIGENAEWGLENRGWTEELLEDGAVERAKRRAEDLCLCGEKSVSFSSVWKIVPPSGSPSEKEKNQKSRCQFWLGIQSYNLTV